MNVRAFQALACFFFSFSWRCDVKGFILVKCAQLAHFTITLCEFLMQLAYWFYENPVIVMQKHLNSIFVKSFKSTKTRFSVLYYILKYTNVSISNRRCY